MTFEGWISKHALTFGMGREGELAMLAEWADLFERAGFTAGELAAATEWLALHDYPAWRGDHVGALRRRVEEARKPAPAAREAPPPDSGCTLCGHLGWVSVPSRKAMARGLWGTERVCCECPLGAWRAAGEAQHLRARFDRLGGRLDDAPSLAGYEAELERDRWQALMALHAECVPWAPAPALGGRAEALDAALGKVGRMPGRVG